MNLKSSFDNAKQKIKDNFPIILATTAAVGSAVVVVYTSRKSMHAVTDYFYPKGDFSLYLSGREVDKLKAGIPRAAGPFDDTELFVATKDMLKERYTDSASKLLHKTPEVSG